MLASTQSQSFWYRLSHFFNRASIVDPAQFGHALVIGLARQMIERITQKMHITALPSGFWKILLVSLPAIQHDHR